MQIVRGSERNFIGDGHGAYAWGSDERDMVNTLMGAARHDHENHRGKLRFMMVNLLTGVGAAVRRS